MNSDRSLLRFEHVSVSYGQAPVVEDVDFEIASGEFVGVVGPSGSGKTTLLLALLGSLNPVHGRIVRRDPLRVAYVPQVGTVDWTFPARVRDVVTMSIPRPRFRRLDSETSNRVDAVLGQLGLTGLADRHIAALSGGQQQRVFLARALVQAPDLLVLDEPTAGVDVATRQEILHLLTDINSSGVAVLLTTHDINGVGAHLPRLICVNRTVVASGPPAEVLHPYVLERTYGSPMQVLQLGGVPLVVERSARSGALARERSA